MLENSLAVNSTEEDKNQAPSRDPEAQLEECDLAFDHYKLLLAQRFGIGKLLLLLFSRKALNALNVQLLSGEKEAMVCG